MHKFWATFRLTYLKKIKAKSFIISTLIAMLVIVGAANIDKIIDFFDDGNSDDQVAIVTQNNSLYEAVKAQNEPLHQDTTYQHLTEEKATKALKKGDIDYIIAVTETKGHQLEGTIIDTQSVSETDKLTLQSTLSQIQKTLIAQDLNLSENDLQQLEAKSKVQDKILSDKKGTKTAEPDSESEEGISRVIVMVGNFVIFFIVMNYANQIAMELATEKTSRVSEMIITSIRPMAHILSKILAILSVAFTQLLIFAVTVVGCFYAFDLSAKLTAIDFELTPHLTRLLVFSVCFIILSVISYVILAAILGNLTVRIEDMAQSLMPMTLILIGAFYAGYFGALNPDNILVRILSYVPFFSPFVTLSRLSLVETPMIEGIIGIAIHIVLIGVLVFIAAKTYKNSVLTFEKGTIKSLKRALKKS
ncbi:ABC transporter permease [Staphylococcus sp. 17KM0847]|uniref:ABC transporter permease n=1 Tax=Staphylococcus sp. 17KM0847 TaxID=2583989 RepID=UPI0015DBD80B|nr:ABC transporter permease [Staphylococcus sp. 17KM0847]QLK86697.1 ABC transporter permease [Staphylococcus sp. 17KM0847]